MSARCLAPTSASPALSAELPSPPGSTRGSIISSQEVLRRRWIAGSSPAMTNAGAPYPYLTMSNSPIQRSAARCGASGPRVGVERGGEPRRRGQLDELRLDIRLRGHHVGAYPCAVVANEKLDRVPERAVRPSEDESVAIAQRGEIGGLDRHALRFPFPHRLDDLMQPPPTLRRDARAALIDLAAATSPAPAGFVVARAP